MAEMEGEGVKELVIWTLEGSAGTKDHSSHGEIEDVQVEDCMAFPDSSIDYGTPSTDVAETDIMSDTSISRDESCSSGLPLIRYPSGSTIDDSLPTSPTEHCDIATNVTPQADYSCGVGKCRPNCFQMCANIKLFIFMMSLLTMLSSALSTGYFNSVITTIEKRFEMGSSLTGLIAASYEFGSLVATIFVSYFGPRRHVPQLIGIGVMFIGLGSCLFTLPHFIADTYTSAGGFTELNLTEQNICNVGSRNKADFYANKCIYDSGNGIYVVLLIVAMVFIGTGNTPIFTLGTTYIDDHVSKKKAPSYIAFMYASSAMGPVVGFGLGALLLQYYVDLFTFDHSVLQIDSNDPRWVGAWWGGFILLGFLLMLTAVPFFCFPRKLRDIEKVKGREKQAGDEHYGRNIKGMPRAFWKLLTNPIFLVSCFGICCEISIVSGFVTFLPKYLENEFSLNNSVANLYTGGIAIPGAILGIMFGGYIMRRLQMGTRGAMHSTMASCILALSGFGLFFYLGCDNMNLAGATLPYYGIKTNISDKTRLEPNLTSSCNLHCDCSNNDVELICGNNGVTYFSPCHAGCTQLYSDSANKPQNFSDCACIMGSNNMSTVQVIASPMAKRGPCDSQCQTFIPFMMLLFLLTFFTGVPQIPLLMVIMRSVQEKERTFALGTQIILVRLFAYIPSPILFGSLIDTTCLLWKETCGNKGACLIYDIESFRYKYVGIGIGLKVVGTVLFSLVTVMLWRRDKGRNNDVPTSTIRSSVTAETNITTLAFESTL